MHKSGLFKKTSSILLALLLFASVFFIPVQGMQPETGTLKSPALPRYAASAARSGLLDYEGSIDIAQMKRVLKNAVTSYAGVVSFGSNYKWPATQETMQLIATLISCEIPEGFHFEYVEATYNTATNYITSLDFDYNMSKEEYTEKMYACKQQADALLYGIKDNKNLTDVQKALLLHDRLALHCEYGDINGSYLDTATMYGALVGRRPVCQGYAIAYTYLLEQIGIESDMCISDDMNHAWNIVYIDDEAYHVDVTWDDPTPDIPGQVYHYNFLLSTAKLKEGFGDIYDNAHNANDFTAPPTSSKYDTAYWQNSYTAFQLFNNKVYYIDNKNASLCDAETQQVLTEIEGLWYINPREFLMECYANLSSDADHLYYSTPKAIYAFDPSDSTSVCVYTPPMNVNNQTYYSLLGFKQEAGVFRYVLCNEQSVYFAEHQYCTAHAWDDGIVYKKAYCHSDGIKVHTCTICRAVRIEREKDPNSHADTYADNYVSPTCGTPGKNYDSICRACGEIAKIGDEIPPRGAHSWVEDSVLENETCAGVQHVFSTCSVCNAEKEDIRITQNAVHTGETELRDVKEPTCGVYGYTGDLYCLACEQIVQKGEDIPKKKEHTWDEGSVLNPPSELYEGTLRYQCTVCRRTKDEPIPPTGIPPVQNLGDVFFDGKVNAQDARLALRASVGLEALDAAAAAAADVDNDNAITAADARFILRFSVGLEKKWPNEN